MLFLVGMMLLLVYTASLRPTPMLPPRSVSVSVSVSVFMAVVDDEKGLFWFVLRMFFFFVLIAEKKTDQKGKENKKVNQYRIFSFMFFEEGACLFSVLLLLFIYLFLGWGTFCCEENGKGKEKKSMNIFLF